MWAFVDATINSSSGAIRNGKPKAFNAHTLIPRYGAFSSPFTRYKQQYILAALMWLSILNPILLTILVIVCVLLTLVVLMQRPKNEGLGAAFGSGMTENIFGAQTATVLTKATVYLGIIFFVLTLLLTMLTARQSADKRVGVLESEAQKAATLPVPSPTVAASPAASPGASVSPATSVAPSPTASASPEASAAPKSETSATPAPSATP
jgi:preprotein translocase subunit SecG